MLPSVPVYGFMKYDVIPAFPKSATSAIQYTETCVQKKLEKIERENVRNFKITILVGAVFFYLTSLSGSVIIVLVLNRELYNQVYDKF